MWKELRRDLHRQLFTEMANRSSLRACYLFIREPATWMTVVYRLGTWLVRLPRPVRVALYGPYMVLLWNPMRIISGIELFPVTPVGPGICFKHWGGIIISYASRIGSDVTIFNDVTLGADLDSPEAPEIGDGVVIGVGSKLIGGVKVGDNSIIGAGSIVVRDIPPNVVAAGNPARVLRDR